MRENPASSSSCCSASSSLDLRHRACSGTARTIPESRRGVSIPKTGGAAGPLLCDPVRRVFRNCVVGAARCRVRNRAVAPRRAHPSLSSDVGTFLAKPQFRPDPKNHSGRAMIGPPALPLTSHR